MKIRSKLVKSTINNKDILETFQELLGASETNACLPVAHPKYVKLQTHVNRFLRLSSMFHDSLMMTKFPDIKVDFKSYITSLEKNFNESFNAPDLEQYCIKSHDTLAGHNYDTVPPDVKLEFSKAFTYIKKCNIVNIIIVICKNLLQYTKHIEDKKNLNDIFLTRSAGNIIDPFPDLPQLNFKRLYNSDIVDANDKQFILMFLSKLYEITHDVYTSLSSPDVDVNEFIAIIIGSIDQIKRHIPRCNEAFDKIVESVDILKNNFDGYYKDFLSSNNNTAIIMENFVLDVSKKTKATPRLTAQFRKIISYYRKMSSQNSSDPRLKTLFKHVERNFTELEKHQNDLDKDVEDDDDEENTNDNTKDTTEAEIEFNADVEDNDNDNYNDVDKESETSVDNELDDEPEISYDINARIIEPEELEKIIDSDDDNDDNKKNE